MRVAGGALRLLPSSRICMTRSTLSGRSMTTTHKITLRYWHYSLQIVFASNTVNRSSQNRGSDGKRRRYSTSEARRRSVEPVDAERSRRDPPRCGLLRSHAGRYRFLRIPVSSSLHIRGSSFPGARPLSKSCFSTTGNFQEGAISRRSAIHTDKLCGESPTSRCQICKGRFRGRQILTESKLL